ncbi:hypothetical protein GW17_00044519 [Ensete ventricosum]|nr:hypothetical protein GW17_00044519 [Ensete ventricosum]
MRMTCPSQATPCGCESSRRTPPPPTSTPHILSVPLPPPNPATHPLLPPLSLSQPQPLLTYPPPLPTYIILNTHAREKTTTALVQRTGKVAFGPTCRRSASRPPYPPDTCPSVVHD